MLRILLNVITFKKYLDTSKNSPESKILMLVKIETNCEQITHF